MIGRQIRLYLHPDDQTEIVEILRSEMQSVLFTPRSASPKLNIVESWRAAVFLRICPAPLVEALVPEHIAARDEWYFDSSGNPLVEWSLSIFNDDQLYPGRFYYVPKNHNQAGAPPKDARFLEFAEQLFKTLKKITRMVDTDWGRERLGRAAASKLRDGELQLAMNSP